MRYDDAIYHLEKVAILAQTGRAITGGLGSIGKGSWNLAFGGKTHGGNVLNYAKSGQKSNLGKWDPFHGMKNLGRERVTYGKDAGAMAGMRKLDPVTGEPMIGKFKPGTYLKQEFEGSRPGRANYFASQLAGKKGEGFDYSNYKNTGELLRAAENNPNIAKHITSVNSKSMGQFAKENPGVAGKYYGLNLLQKGFLAGLPANELYQNVANNDKRDPNASTAANAGSTLGEGLGWLGSMPLGLVGGSLVAEGMSRGGKALGGIVDSPKENFRMPQRNNPMVQGNLFAQHD